MKSRKILSVLLLVATLLTSLAIPALADAERTEAANNVIDMIMALNTNTKPDDLVAVKDAYAALTPEEQQSVFNYSSLVQFEQDYARTINDELAAIDLKEFDLFSGEKVVDSLTARYNALSDEAKALVTQIEKLGELENKLYSLHEFMGMRPVSVLSSTMRGLAEYDLASVRALAEAPSEGIYYYFEEVEFIEDEGDPNTGYYDIDPNNEKVKLYSYAKLEMDVNVTDLDFNQCWPAFKFNVGGDFWAGYDFVNEAFFIAKITKWSHGRFVDYRAFEGKEWDLGVWHHLCLEWNGESLAITFDGEKVLDAQYDGTYQYLIMYPWSCNLELTNVHFTDKNGNDVLSPFRNSVNYDNWTRSSNEDGATMLDVAEESLANTRAVFEGLSDEQKALVTDSAQIARVQALIDAVRAGKHTVAVESGSADAELAAEGDTVTLTADEAEEGMVFDKWVVVSGDAVLADERAAETTFVMPAADVELKATYKVKTAFTSGDANGDGKINAKDVTAVMKSIVGAEVKDFIAEAADFDQNGKINAKDVTALMKYIVANA